MEEVEGIFLKMLKVKEVLSLKVKESGIGFGKYDGRVCMSVTNRIIEDSNSISEALTQFGDLTCRWCGVPMNECQCVK